MNRFFIVRHGETFWNIDGRTQGHGDSKLTEDGIKQAQRLAKKLLKYDIDYIYSSDLGRTIQTSEMISNTLNKKVEYKEQLREINFGKWEGLTIQEIKRDYPDVYTVWRNKPHKALIPEGENLYKLKQRLLDCINELNKKHENSNIVLVSHGMSIKVLLLSLLESELSNIYRIKQDNTALNIVEFRNYGPVIMKTNDTIHLEGEKYE